MFKVRAKYCTVTIQSTLTHTPMFLFSPPPSVTLQSLIWPLLLDTHCVSCMCRSLSFKNKGKRTTKGAKKKVPVQKWQKLKMCKWIVHILYIVIFLLVIKYLWQAIVLNIPVCSHIILEIIHVLNCFSSDLTAVVQFFKCCSNVAMHQMSVTVAEINVYSDVFCPPRYQLIILVYQMTKLTSVFYFLNEKKGNPYLRTEKSKFILACENAGFTAVSSQVFKSNSYSTLFQIPQIPRHSLFFMLYYILLHALLHYMRHCYVLLYYWSVC